MVDRVSARRREQGAARRIAPGTDKCGQARHGAHGIAAAVHALHAVIQANGGRLDRAVVAGKPNHLRGGDAAGLRNPLRRPLRRTRREFREAQGIAVDVIVVEQVLRDKDVHQSQRQRTVGAGQQRNVLVAFIRGGAAVGIYGDKLGAATLGLLHAGPQVQVGRDRVAAPDHDQLAVLELLDVHADGCAHGRCPARLARRGTDGAVQE